MCEESLLQLYSSGLKMLVICSGSHNKIDPPAFWLLPLTSQCSLDGTWHRHKQQRFRQLTQKRESTDRLATRCAPHHSPQAVHSNIQMSGLSGKQQEHSLQDL